MAFTDLGSLNFTNAVEATRAFPVTAVPVGTTKLQAAITRGSLDPAIVLAWSLEVSRDGGTNWLSWGAGGTTAGTFFDKHGNLITESDFEVFLTTPADAQTRVRGSLTNTGARMTTTITIRSDTTPIPQHPVQEHHSVLYDNFIEVRGSAVTTLTSVSFVITSAANSVAVLGLVHDFNGATGITSICGGVSGALVAGTDTASTWTSRSLIHLVKVPASGSQTASMSWTPAKTASLGAMTASGVNQGTPTNTATVATGTSATPSITLATAAGDLTFAIVMVQNLVSAPTQTQLWIDSTDTGGGGSRGPGTGSSDIHSWTQTSGNWGMSGVNLVALASPPDYSLFPKPIMQPIAAFPENR